MLFERVEDRLAFGEASSTALERQLFDARQRSADFVVEALTAGQILGARRAFVNLGGRTAAQARPRRAPPAIALDG